MKEKGREVTLKLADFVIPTDDVPEEARKIKHWSQMVDYGLSTGILRTTRSTTNGRLTGRAKTPRSSSSEATYTEPGKYRMAVKVIEIRNDTTKPLEVTIR